MLNPSNKKTTRFVSSFYLESSKTGSTNRQTQLLNSCKLPRHLFDQGKGFILKSSRLTTQPQQIYQHACTSTCCKSLDGNIAFSANERNESCFEVRHLLCDLQLNLIRGPKITESDIYWKCLQAVSVFITLYFACFRCSDYRSYICRDAI